MNQLNSQQQHVVPRMEYIILKMHFLIKSARKITLGNFDIYGIEKTLSFYNTIHIFFMIFLWYFTCK